MPPGVKFPGEEIVRAALALVREQGDTLRVRAVYSCARRAERAERVRSGTGLQKRGASSFGSSSFSRLRTRHISCGVCRR